MTVQQNTICARTFSFANEYVHTVQLQYDRMYAEDVRDDHFPLRVYADIKFFILALTWLEKSTREMGKYPVWFPSIQIARDRFKKAIPNLELMRNVSEHIEEYMFDRGKKSHVKRDQLQVSQWSKEEFYWLQGEDGEHLTINFKNALEAARELYSAVRLVCFDDD